MNSPNGNQNEEDFKYRVAIYARYSSELQNEISIEDQVSRCKEEIAKRGWRVAGVYTDSAKHGWSLDRDGFQEMRSAAEKRKFDAAMFWKFDRLARDHNQTVMIKALLRHQCGLKLHCVEGVSEDDDNSAHGALVEQMIAVFSAFYSRNLSTDTKRAKRARAMRGEYNGSVPPLGYILITKSNATPDRPVGLYIDPVLAPILVEAFVRYSTGKYSDPEIAEWLNKQPAIKAVRQGRKPMGKDTVRDIIQNRVYTGQIPYCETLYDGSTLGQRKKTRRHRIVWYDGKHEAIISTELFEKCLNVRAGLRRTFHTLTTARTYVLQDRCYCAHCIATDHHNLGDPHYGKMRLAWSDKLQAGQLRCVARDRGYRKCGQSYVKEAIILEQVVSMLSRMSIPADVTARIDSAVQSRKSNGEALEQVAKLEEQIQRIQYSWEQGLLDPDKYVEKMHQLQREIASLRPLDYDRLEEANDLITHFRKYWDQCAEVENPEEARQQLMAKVVDRVFVYGDKVIAIALPSDLGVVLDIPEAAPSQVLSAVSSTATSKPVRKNKSASTNGTRTQHGSDGLGIFTGHVHLGSSQSRLPRRYSQPSQWNWASSQRLTA